MRITSLPRLAAAAPPFRYALYAALAVLLALLPAVAGSGPAEAAVGTAATAAGSLPSTVQAAPAVQAVPPGDGAVYRPVVPRRVMQFVPVGHASTYTLKLSGVPAGATAVALNVTATFVSARTFVSACAGGVPAETCRQTSALNAEPGEDTPSAVLVELGGANKDEVTFYNNVGSVRLIADLHGFYVPATVQGSSFVAAGPDRVLARTAGPGQAITVTLPGVPAGATAVAMNVTSTAATAASFVAACPADQPLSTCTQSSVLNPAPGRDAANHTVVKLGGPRGDQVTLYNNAGSLFLIADVQGFFADRAAPGAANLRIAAPSRVLAFHRMSGPESLTLTLPDVPAGATAVALNVTATATSQVSYISVCAGGAPLASCSATSVQNPRPGADTANNVKVPLGGPDRDQVVLYNNTGRTSLVVDVVGYFVAGGSTQAPGGDPGTPPAVDPTFTLAVVPDTQQDVFTSRILNRGQWLVQNRDALDLEFVLHTGDVVNWDTPGHEQYEDVSRQLAVLDDARVPTTLAVGNHDTYATGEGGSARDPRLSRQYVRDTRTFNTYFSTARYGVEGTFEPGKIDNSYQLFSAGGVDWMILTLELWARPEAIEWARQVVAANPGRNVVVLTHAYLEGDGSISVSNGGYGATSPQYLFDTLISRYPNIKMVFSGHVGAGTSRIDTGVNGNRIVSYLGAYHSSTSNPLRLVTVDTRNGTVSSRVYSPMNNQVIAGDQLIAGLSFR